MTHKAALTQSHQVAMTHAMQAHVVDPVAAQAKALGLISSQARRGACVLAYGDAFWIVAVGLIVSLEAVLLLKKPQRAATPVDEHWFDRSRTAVFAPAISIADRLLSTQGRTRSRGRAS